MVWILYGSSRDIETNQLGWLQVKEEGKAVEMAKDFAKMGFACVHRIKTPDNAFADTIVCFWKEDYWEDFFERKEKFGELV